jgi:hypothetical protein
MKIDSKYHAEIKKLDVNAHKVECEYSYWEEWFEEDESMLSRVSTVKAILGERFGRSEVVDFYKGKSDNKTKFLATMIWGHEAPAGSRRDTRGPWKVEQMFKSIEDSVVLDTIKVETESQISSAYSALNKAIKRCGPSFITKHLYFLGKSLGKETYPLIYDDRVSVGLVKISLQDTSCLDLVSIHAEAKAKAYLAYLKFAAAEAKVIGCQLDQIEYFLFEHAG